MVIVGSVTSPLHLSGGLAHALRPAHPHILVPLGTDLVLWDRTRHQMVVRIPHAHPETISAMATFPGGALTGSFDGSVRAWSDCGDRLWRSPILVRGDVIEALSAVRSIAKTMVVAVVSRERRYHSNGTPVKPERECPRDATVTVFVGDDGGGGDGEEGVAPPGKSWEVKGGYYCVDFAGPERLVAGVSVPWEGEDLPEYLPSFSRLQCVRVICAATGQVLVTARMPGSRMWTMAVRPDHSALAVVFHDGSVEVREVPELEKVVWRRDAVAPGARCLAWRADGLELALPVKGARIRLLDAAAGGEARATELPGLSGATRMISYDGLGGLWAANEFNLAHIASVGAGLGQECNELEIHRLSCCGCDVSGDGQRVAVGDLGGQVILYDTEGVLDLGSHPSYSTVQTPTYDSVRSVAFVPDSHAVAFGTLGGDLWLWSGGAGAPELLDSYGSSIACLDFHGARRLALGLVDGRVIVLDGKDHGAWARQTETQAHGEGLEVWSLAWSPDGSRLATASEDFTCRVWTVCPARGALDLLATLSGHTAAATCVDWREGVLATCSDDRTVRLYSDSLDLVHVLKTKDLFVTYLSIHSGKLACVTEDGYRSVFDLKTNEPISYKKLHLGSIEGCRWRAGVLVTCSSDCTVSIEKVD
jgi:hypothetical protein